MSGKTVTFTQHAEAVIIQRQLRREWAERVARDPEWVEHETNELERRFAAVPEKEGRFLRVVCLETSAEIRIITVFLDRNARRPL